MRAIWDEGGELHRVFGGIWWLYTLLVCTYTVHGMSINTALVYHLSLLLHVHVHCMLQFVSCPHPTIQLPLILWWIPLWPVRG